MQKQLTRLPFVILALALAALVSVPVSAHHGWGGNSEQQSELTGTVEVPVSLAGPHATMKVRVDGQVWDITMAPPNRTQAAGLKGSQNLAGIALAKRREGVRANHPSTSSG